jgi:hypothetical protein
MAQVSGLVFHAVFGRDTFPGKGGSVNVLGNVVNTVLDVDWFMLACIHTQLRIGSDTRSLSIGEEHKQYDKPSNKCQLQTSGRLAVLMGLGLERLQAILPPRSRHIWPLFAEVHGEREVRKQDKWRGNTRERYASVALVDRLGDAREE